MRQSRIYTRQSLRPGHNVELAGSTGHYLTRVLRLSEGDPLILFNGDGRDYSAEVSEVQRQQVCVRIVDSHVPGNESVLRITLVQAISRGERMDYCLQKATELGVFCIQPVMCRRVEVRLNEKRQAKRLAHWRGVVVSACEQSGRAVIPDVREPVSLHEWMMTADEFPQLVLDPQAEVKISSLSTIQGSLSILVGPEGGLSRQELDDVMTQGVMAVSLGPRVLRTETAGPAAIAVLQAVAGDG